MNQNTSIQETLFSMGDAEYKAFQSKLLPNIDPALVIGVRTPKLRVLAKKIAKTPESERFLSSLPHAYYEENNLHAFLIEQTKDFEETIALVDAFLPYIDNWATCDALRPKSFKLHREQLLGKIRVWLMSSHPYTVRFAIEMLMVHFLDGAFEPLYLEMTAKIQSSEYYVRMMVAWYFATALAEQYEPTIEYLRRRRLDRWTHNKTIQKAIESYRIPAEQKEYLRSLRY